MNSSYALASIRALSGDRSAALILIIQPASKASLVDRFGGVIEGLVDLDDFAGDSRIERAGGLDRFDLAELATGLCLGSHLGQLDEGDIRQLVGGELADCPR